MTMLDKRSKLRSTEVEAISKMIVKRFYFSDPTDASLFNDGPPASIRAYQRTDHIQMGDWET
jgi:hypothetical protein